MSLGAAAARWLAVAGLVVAVDLATKQAALGLTEPVRVLPGVQLDLGYNSGVAFGALKGLPPSLLVAGVAAVLCALLIGTWRGMISPPWPATGLLLGGAVANLLDRAADGRVTDFIDPVRWPAFNVADIAITVGVALLLVAGLRDERRAKATTA